MARKSKQTKDELDKIKFQLEEAEKLFNEAIEEENQRMNSLEQKIKTIAKENGMFCGVILSKEDLVNVVRIMLENQGDNVKIPFKLYFNE